MVILKPLASQSQPLTAALLTVANRNRRIQRRDSIFFPAFAMDPDHRQGGSQHESIYDWADKDGSTFHRALYRVLSPTHAPKSLSAAGDGGFRSLWYKYLLFIMIIIICIGTPDLLAKPKLQHMAPLRSSRGRNGPQYADLIREIV